MSNYYISECCRKPVGTIIRGRAICPECKKIKGIIAMLDTPGGVPKADCTICGRKGGHMAKIPTDTSYTGGVNFDPNIRPEEKLPEDIWFDEQVNLALDKQKAEIISLIMGMETKDKGRESDEFDQGMEIMRAKIINKIRAIK
jgi:hypothetical protein